MDLKHVGTETFELVPSTVDTGVPAQIPTARDSEAVVAADEDLFRIDEEDIENDEWDRDFVFPEPKERWTQEVTLIYRGREKAPQMVFPDEVFMDDVDE